MLSVSTHSLPSSASSSLDMYDVPVKHKLEVHLNHIGYVPARLGPIVDAALQEGKRTISPAMSSFNPTLIRERIYQSAIIYLNGVLSQTRKWNLCRELIRSYSSIFIAGAGVSFESGLPLSSTLQSLLHFCGATNWDELRADSSKCSNFKTQFKVLNDRRQPSTSHRLLISNFPNNVLEIISLNWDNLFERAAILTHHPIDKQNQDVPTTGIRHLWKFHGDVELITHDNVAGQGGWLFPDEPGYVFTSFLQYITNTNLANEPFTLIIIGYSETDQAIYDNIIAPLEKIPPRPTYRIGLRLEKLHDDGYIVGTSDFILREIL